jgi:hypothetical protein
MSYTETHQIKLKEIKVNDLEEWVKNRCQEYRPELKDPADEGEDTWFDVYYYYIVDIDQNYMILNGKLYKVIEHIDLSHDDVNIVNVNDDGIIEIITSFYNGGCGLNEALEYNLEKLKKK